jgi:hypothetical protein
MCPLAEWHRLCSTLHGFVEDHAAFMVKGELTLLARIRRTTASHKEFLGRVNAGFEIAVAYFDRQRGQHY